MPQTSKKPRIFPIKIKIKTKPELDKAKSTLTPKLQSFKEDFLTANGFIKYK